jgi:hypothetical protein
MTVKKDDLTIQSQDLIEEDYVPSETERKRVVVYYFLVGILFALSNNHLSKYEYYHLKQAIGWWIVFFLVFVTSLLVIWVPLIRVIPWLAQIVLVGIWVFFVKQARDGKYTLNVNGQEKVPLPIFAALGNWLLELFDKKFEVKD